MDEKARFWLRMMRYSCLVSFVATLVPDSRYPGELWVEAFSYFSNMNDYLVLISNMAWDPFTIVTFFYFLVFMFMKTGLIVPVSLFVLSLTWKKDACIGSVCRYLHLALFAVSVYFPVRVWSSMIAESEVGNLPPASWRPETLKGVLVATLLAFLLACGLSVLAWRDKRNSAQEAPVLLVIPLTCQMLFWWSAASVVVWKGTSILICLAFGLGALSSSVLAFALFRYCRLLRAQNAPNSPLRHS